MKDKRLRILELPKIRTDKDVRELNEFYLIVLPKLIGLILILLMVFLRVDFAIIIIITLIIAPLQFRFRRIYSDWPKKYDIIGKVEFNEVNLKSISKEIKIEFDYSEISYIELYFNYIKGLAITYYDCPHNGLALLNINLNNGECKKIKMLIENKDQFFGLTEILRIWYKKGIKVSEYCCRQKTRTILLKSDLTYKEIQELKKELNVRSFI